MPTQVIVGLDIGTSGVKAAAFGVGSTWRRTALREYPLIQPAPGYQVQDPGAILAGAADALAECVTAADPAEVLAVSVSTAMHGLIALDGDGRPLTPVITWADARASDEAQRLHRSGEAAALHAITGVPVHPMSSLTKLMWFAANDHPTWGAARWWVELKAYVLSWLTGRLATELSSASATGLLDMSTRSWSPEALEVSGITADRLPPILPTTTLVPMSRATAGQVGLPGGVPVVAGAADGPLANLGTGAMTSGVVGLSLGTSGAIRMTVDEPFVDSARTLFCYALTDAVWVVGGALSNGGEVMRWAGRSLAPDIEAAAVPTQPGAVLLDLAATAPAGSEGLVMLPFLLPERAPLWRPDLSGALLGLRHDHTRAHLLRAAVEGVCMQMRPILDRLDDIQPVQSVRATGGAFRSALWRQVMAATLGRPLYIVDDAEGTALGAAALGLFALGRAPTLIDATTQLADLGEPPPPPVEADPQLVVIYDGLRASVAGLLEGLVGVSPAPAGTLGSSR